MILIGHMLTPLFNQWQLCPDIPDAPGGQFVAANTLLPRGPLLSPCGSCLFQPFDFILTTRYTCPFVEKFSIDIETYYKPDTGDQVDVFNLSAADKRQRTIGETTWFSP